MRQDGGWKRRALQLAFARHGEDGCMILVFVLRKIGSCVGARRWLGHVRPASKPRVVPSGKETVPFCRAEASASAIGEGGCTAVSEH